jgi:hypothetical protein
MPLPPAPAPLARAGSTVAALARVGSTLTPQPVAQAAILRAFHSENERLSRAFTAAAPARAAFRAAHPTSVLAFECMDGRVNVEAACGLPPGALAVCRNLGGTFDVGWPALRSRLLAARDAALRRGTHLLCIVTFHHSATSAALGCAGHACDTARARASAAALVAELEAFFRPDALSQAAVVLAAFETDAEALTFFAADGGAHACAAAGRAPAAALHTLLPELPRAVVRDLAALADGNAAHVARRRGAKGVADLGHDERVIVIGTADWLSTANHAIVIDDADPELGVAIAAAAGIVLENLDRAAAAGAPGGGLIISAIAFSCASERAAAAAGARYLARLARRAVARALEGVADGVFEFVAAVSDETRRLEVLRG